MNRPLVSIITPVYNAEPYLRRCLDSLLHQTYANIEVIAVDDCSTDGSRKILEDYAQRDSRLRIFSTAVNSGASAARNIAVKHSRGAYIGETDADDWLNEDTIEHAMDILLNDTAADIAVFSLCIHHENSGISTMRQISEGVPSVMTGEEACYWSLGWDIAGVFVAKREVYERDAFQTDAGIYGDENTTHLQLLHAKRVCLARNAIYNYSINDTSVTHSSKLRQLQILKGRSIMHRQLKAEGVSRRTLRHHNMVRLREAILLLKKMFL